MHRQGKLHNNADAMSRLPYMNCESDIPDVSIVANTSLLPVYSPQDVRTRQLEDNLIGPFLRAKEIGDQPPSMQKGPKGRKMVQLWNHPVKTVLQEIFISCKYFSCKTCKILH